MTVTKVPKINPKTGKNVGFRWRFWEYDPELKRNKAVSQDQIPLHIRESQEDSVVLEYVKSQNALTDAKIFRCEQRSKWKELYTDFTKLLERFSKFHSEKAKNSWKTDIYYLEKYVFHFYLDLRSYNNLYDWKFHFEDFKEWLRDIKPLKVKKDRLAKNTQNKCMKALNRFLAWAYQVNVLVEQQPKCEVYPKEELPRIQPEDLFEKWEEESIIGALKEIRPMSANIFRFLVSSGCRINEALGVSLSAVVEGEITGEHSKKIHDKLAAYGMGNYFGYVVLMNQPELDSLRVEASYVSPITGKQWEARSVPRKPLKHRKVERPEDWRFIPIYDKETWNMLIDLWNVQDELFSKKIHGKNSQDYLLLEGITASMFYIDLEKALRSLKVRWRSPHKCRHTYLSWFYAKTDEDIYLSQKVGGHKDQGSRQIYSHINQQIGLEQTFAIQSKKKMTKIA